MKNFLYLLIIFPLCAFAHPPIYPNKNVTPFIKKMVKKHKFKESELVFLFQSSNLRQDIIKLMNHPSEGMPWNRYQHLLVTEDRIKRGNLFWGKYKKILQHAERKFKVPPSIIVATIGLESNYGKNTGSYRVIDALSTLAFYYPKRARFFKSELEEFLLMVRENNLKPFDVYGSYAGAIGQAQFMPSSYRHYATSFTKNKAADLSHNQSDVIASIANYYHRHGWQYKKPIVYPAYIHFSDTHGLHFNTHSPHYLSGQLKKLGVVSLHRFSKKERLNLINLHNSSGDEYWLGLNNFSTILRYNQSPLYAMAITKIAKALKLRQVKIKKEALSPLAGEIPGSVAFKGERG
jgi:membrane-bound lytic murein transglycosylase B